MRKNKGTIKFKNKKLKFKNKKPKKTKSNSKDRFKKILSWCITILVALVLGFFGYSAIGPAVVRLSKGDTSQSDSTSPPQTDSAGDILSDAD
ncbi:MAG: hypothetical protein LBL93_03395 [Ruminococcus sp.]|jgi:hypothetical protein|nr:hypothetical protein [Ruminococcus sp.]